LSNRLSKQKLNASNKRKRKKINIKTIAIPCSFILNLLLSNQSLHENDIYRKIVQIGIEEKQTGLRNKMNTINSIQFLNQGKLIEKRKDGQVRYISITDLGKEVINLIIAIREYNTAYLHLCRSFYELLILKKQYQLGILTSNPELEAEPKLRLTLKEHREKIKTRLTKPFPEIEIKLANTEKFSVSFPEISRDDLQYYSLSVPTLYDFKTICDKNLYFMIFMRYGLIKKNFNLTDNVDNLLVELIFDSINKKILYLLSNYDKEIIGYTIIKSSTVEPRAIFSTDTGINTNLFYEISNIFKKDPIPLLYSLEIKNMLIAYLNLLKPSSNELEKFDEEIRQTYKDTLIKLKTLNQNSNFKNNPKKQVLEYLRIKTYFLYFYSYMKMLLT
jgi:hypothetical protein